MYKLTIRGQEEVIVDDKLGKQLFDAFIGKEGAKPLPAKVAVGNIAFYAQDIRKIVKIQKTEAEKANVLEDDSDYRRYRETKLALPIAKRAENVQFAETIYRSLRKVAMPDDVREAVVERQIAYFTENPYCIYPNPKVWRDLMGRVLPYGGKSEMNHISELLPVAGIHLIQNLVQTDLVYSAQDERRAKRLQELSIGG